VRTMHLRTHRSFTSASIWGTIPTPRESPMPQGQTRLAIALLASLLWADLIAYLQAERHGQPVLEALERLRVA
jgi:hypothetical protein